MPKIQTIQQRFNSKYKINRQTGCWEWTACTIESGYGRFHIKKNGKGTLQNAHRVSYELFKGPIPDNKLVCHSCDNPICVNPKHLFVGSHQENMDDMVSKKRYNANENMRKLTDDDVTQVKQLSSSGITAKEISKQFKVSYKTILKYLKKY